MKKTVIKIILADDHGLFREGFRFMLRKVPTIELLAEACDGQELLDLIVKLQPDVVVTDIKMPVLDGVEVMKKLKVDFPDLPVIALTTFDEENLILEMLEAGAKGYLLKSANNEEIIEAIETVFTHKQYYCSHVTPKLTEMILRSTFDPYQSSKKISLNERELSIIQLICAEKTNQQIAEELFLSKRTIENYRENIIDKMQVKNTAGIVIYAIKNGLYKI